MRPRPLVLVAVVILVFGISAPALAWSVANPPASAARPPATAACPATATPASTVPLGSPVPAGVAFRLLAEYLAETPADLFYTFELGRFALEPGTQAPVQEGNFLGPGLLYVESGEVVVHLPNGTETVVCAGGQTPLGAEAEYSIRNDGSANARLVRLRVGFIAAVAAYSSTKGLVRAGLLAAPRMNGGFKPEPLADGVTYQPLVIADLDSLPAESSRLFLADTRWEPGAAFDGWTFCGPVGMAVEGGVLTGREPPEPAEGQFPQGHFVFYPPHDPARVRNAGADPATVLMAGVIPADLPFATSAATCGGD